MIHPLGWPGGTGPAFFNSPLTESSLMKNTTATLDYPKLESLPAYRAEADKLNKFTNALAKAETDSTALHSAWLASLETRKAETEADRIEQAETLLSGARVSNYSEQSQELETLILSLKRAKTAQENVLFRLTRDLSKSAAKRFETEHKAITRRVMAAVAELHAANMSEIALNDGLEALGYLPSLPCLRFNPPKSDLDTESRDGGYAVAWFKEVAEYTQTDAQREAAAVAVSAATRRAKMARLTAGEPS